MATVTRPTFNPAEMQRRVRHPLQSVRGTIRRYVLLEGALLAVLYLSIGCWLGLALDFGLFYLLRFDWLLELQEATGNSADVWLRGIILTLFLAGLVVLVTYKVFFRLFREFRDEAVALVLERRFPRQLGDRLITAVELADPKKTEKYGYSPAMIEKTIEEAANRVESVPVSGVFNWGRLYKLGFFAGLTTIGVYLLVMIAGMILIGTDAMGEDAAAKSSSSPFSFFGRFNRAAGTWVSRDLFLGDSYWRRNAYLDLIRFQDTAKHPGEMRVGSNEERPKVNVRAFRWVTYDERPAREYRRAYDPAVKSERNMLVRNHYGWRPLRFADVEKLLEGDPLVAAAKTIPAKWQGWMVQLDDLDSSVPKHLAPQAWQGKTFGEIDAENTPKSETATRLEALRDPQYGGAADKLFDWRAWTMDRLELELQQPEVLGPLGTEHKAGYDALRGILAKLEEMALADDNRGRVRMLEVPDTVRFYYRGDTTANSDNNEFKQQKEKGLWQRKYALELGELTESVRFHVKGADAFTPTRYITLVPPTGIKKVTLQLKEPAYIYRRIKGDLSELKGLKQTLPEQQASVASETTNITLKYGSDLHFIAEADRPLKGKILVTAPEKKEEKDGLLPAAAPVLEENKLRFHLDFKNVREPYEFLLEFNDEDNVKGRRRVIIKPKEDTPPDIVDIALKIALRKPLMKKEDKEGGSRLIEFSRADIPSDAVLITPDAELPFRGIFKDDYGLTKAYWRFEYEPKHFELQGDVEEAPKTSVFLAGPPALRRLSLLGTAFQYAPGHAALFTQPEYLALTSQFIDLDLKMGPEDGMEKLRSFEKRLAELSLRDPVKADLATLLTKDPGTPAMLRDHQLTEADHFFVSREIQKIKSKDSAKEGQMHFLIKINLEVVDSNVETGPGVTRSKATFSFLVVSENELLAQIALEEETLRDSLEGAEKNVKDAQLILQQLKEQFDVKTPDFSFDTTLLLADSASNLLSKADSAIRQAASSYDRIAEELHFNRIKEDRQTQLIVNILEPLKSIHLPGGEKTKIDDAMGALIGQLEADRRVKVLDPKNASFAKEGIERLDSLLDKLNRVLQYMERDITWARSSELLRTIAKAQDDRARQAGEWYFKEQEKLLKSLLK